MFEKRHTISGTQEAGLTAKQIDELLPWNWKASQEQIKAAPELLIQLMTTQIFRLQKHGKSTTSFDATTGDTLLVCLNDGRPISERRLKACNRRVSERVETIPGNYSLYSATSLQVRCLKTGHLPELK
jgi:hypothetical protein